MVGLFAALSSPSHAATAAEPAAVIGGSTFLANGEETDAARQQCTQQGVQGPKGPWNAFRLLLNLPASPSPDSLTIVGLAVNGSEPAGAREAVWLSSKAGTATLLEIVICADTSRLRIPGTYAFDVIAHWPQPAAERQFSFTLIRKQAALQVPSGLTLRLDDDGKLHPDTLPVQETSGENSIAAIQVTADTIKSGDKTAYLIFDTTPAVRPHGSVDLVPVVKGDLPLGLSTTKLTLSAPEIGPPVSAVVQIVRRLWLGYLLIILIGGVITGYALRVALAGRQAKTTSRLAASQETDRITALAGADQDPTVRQTLMRVAAALTSEADAAMTSAAIDAAVTRRRGEADQIVAAAATRRAALNQLIQRLVDTYSPATPFDPDVAQLVAGMKAQVDLLSRAVNAGQLCIPEAQAADLDRSGFAQLRPLINNWRLSLLNSVRAVLRWPFPGDLTNKASELETSCGANLANLADVNNLAIAIRKWLDETVNRQIAADLHAVADAFTAAQFTDVAASVFAGEAAYRRQPVQASRDARLAPMIIRVSQPREAIATALRSWVPPDQAQAMEDALQAGDIERAIAALGAAPGASAPIMIPGPPGPVRAFAGEIAPAPPIPITLPMKSEFAISAPPFGTVGVATPLQLLMPTALANVRIDWEPATVTPETDRTKAAFTPQASGFFSVSATVRDANNQTILGTATAVILAGAGVMRRNLYVELAIEDAVGTIFSGLVAVWVGYMLLEPTWLGTAKDFGAAFLWGFTVDLGLSHVRDIATQASGKTTVTTPLPR